MASEFVDPARTGSETLGAAFDVFAVGALARSLAPDPPPSHVLARVAVEATSADLSTRPDARALAEALQQEVPAARLPRGLASPPPSRPSPAAAPTDPLAAWRRERGGIGSRRRSGRPRTSAVVAAVAAVAVVGGAVVLAGTRQASAPPLLAEPTQPLPPDEVQPGPPTTGAGVVSSSTTSTIAAVPGRRDCPVPGSLLQPDVDGDGCPDALRYADGVLEAGGIRWAVGRAGDQVATGDWACQGMRTIALFRPSTGDLFRFDGWAGAGVDLQAVAVARVQGGQALRAADVDRDGCHEAVVERATGPAEVIELVRP